jgi:hypothetical protein
LTDITKFCRSTERKLRTSQLKVGGYNLPKLVKKTSFGEI